MASVEVHQHQGELRITLSRPQRRNAMDEVMLDELTAAAALADDPAVRWVRLDGAGSVFCAGADIEWMRRAGSSGDEVNLAEARRLARCFLALAKIPCPVLCVVQGAALGGGTGLAAVADVVIAAEGTRFGFSEVRLGIVPAVISPFALRKIGTSAALRWFQSGAVFEAERARAMGLVHEVCPQSELEAAAAQELSEWRLGAPLAQRVAKGLASALAPLPTAAQMDKLAEQIARQRASSEGQAGLQAFLERRKAPWTRESE
jgi:methylglutaconyl-CoA hydratase